MKMTVKKRIVLLLLSTSLSVSLVFLISLNVYVRHYIDLEARKAILNEKSLFTGVIKGTSSDNQEGNGKTENNLIDSSQTIKGKEDTQQDKGAEWDFKDSIFHVQNILIEEKSTDSNDSSNVYYDLAYDSEECKNIRKYAMENPQLFLNDQIVITQIGQNRIYMTTATLEWELEEGGFALEKRVIYVNTAAVFNIVNLVNKVFLGVLLFSIVGAVLAGIKSGSDIEKAEQGMKRFFENASHELKTPLMSIQGYAEGIQTGVITDTKMGTQIILEQSDRMSALVNELLDLSKISSGNITLEEENIPLCDFVTECITFVSPAATRNSISIQTQYPLKEINIKGDERQLSKLFTSVLSNGIRHARNEIIVSIYIKKHTAFITIEDDGKGISPQDLPHIFKRFYVGESGGSGVGLSLAKEIANLHKGNIVAKSNSKVAIFMISLPLR